MFTSFLSSKVFSFAIKQDRAVGMPVVVRAMQIIKKLNIMWYMPRHTSPITRDRKILYRNPKTLTIKLDINKIMVDKTKLGILKKITSTY